MTLSNWNFLYTDTQYHVHESNKWENRTGYLRTLPCSPVIDGDYGVYAMDCEMVGSALITSTCTWGVAKTWNGKWNGKRNGTENEKIL